MRWALMGAVVALAFVVYTLFHCAMTPSTRVRSLPKGVWLLAIIVLPVIGAGLWYWLGMPRESPTSSAPSRGRGPDDDAEFLRQLDIKRRQQKRANELSEREKDVRRREDDLKRNRDSSPGSASSAESANSAGDPPNSGRDEDAGSHRDDPGH